MTDEFRRIQQALRDTTHGLIAAAAGWVAMNNHLIAIGQALTRATTAASEARDEHEDLRETVRRIEGLVLAQGQELRALRARLEGAPP
jgi:hypothetical protein